MCCSNHFLDAFNSCVFEQAILFEQSTISHKFSCLLFFFSTHHSGCFHIGFNVSFSVCLLSMSLSLFYISPALVHHLREKQQAQVPWHCVLIPFSPVLLIRLANEAYDCRVYIRSYLLWTRFEERAHERDRVRQREVRKHDEAGFLALASMRAHSTFRMIHFLSKM